MNETMPNIIPQEYIRQLYDNMHDDKISITYYPTNGEKPYSFSFQMDCTEADIEALIERYSQLTATLERIALIHDELQNEEKRREILTSEEASVWEIFIKPFKPFEVEEEVIDELFYRGEFDELSEEENELLERFYEWREKDCLERLPYNRKSPMDYITAAKYYERLKSVNAPNDVVKKTEKWLAEEMLKYYCGKQENSNEI